MLCQSAPPDNFYKIDEENRKYIDWDSNRKLTPGDFQSKEKKTGSVEVASASTGFGFAINNQNGNMSGSIFVRYFPESSSWDSNRIDDDIRNYVLKHEQVHFDICELYGRKLYEGILHLHDSGKLNERNLRKLYNKLEKEYTRYQEKYDNETKHSVNRVEQYYWNRRVAEDLKKMSDYAGYSNF